MLTQGFSNADSKSLSVIVFFILFLLGMLAVAWTYLLSVKDGHCEDKGEYC